MPAARSPGPWPTVDETADPLALLALQHQALRDVLEWMPHALDDEGQADPGDGRKLRAFLHGALAWHHADEQAVLLPRLVGLGRAAEDLCQTYRRFQVGVESAADEVSDQVAAICRGEPTETLRWHGCCEALRCALEPAMGFEDLSLIPAVRMLLETDDLRDMASALHARAEGRPELRELCVAPAPLRRMSTITILRAGSAPGVIRRYSDCLERRSVADIMTREVRCTAPDVALTEVVLLFEKAGITGVPVVDDDGRVLGVVSQSDVVRTLALAQTLDGVRVADAMMCAPFCVHESASVEDAAALLTYEGVHRLPVVNAHHEVVGIISALDLVRWRGTHAAEQGTRGVRFA